MKISFKYVKEDIISGFLVFLIALPLCLGISMASGFAPIAGILTAIIGGVMATWIGSAPLTIKGPAAGLIVIALGASTELGYKRALATIVAASVLQIMFALLRAGALGDFFPSAVVHGMLAAIGIIIFAKQAHIALGVTPHSKEPLTLLAELPSSIANLNPEIAVIGILSLVVLFSYPALSRRFDFLRKVPAPLFVLCFAMPLGIYFDLEHHHTYTLSHKLYVIDSSFLVTLPARIQSAITFPDFSALWTATSMKYTVMFSLVGSIESLLSTKAVDTLDPLKRTSNLDRDLLAVGTGNLLSGMLGGLPMISEIVRSTANISYGAKSHHSNFFHGVFLLLFVVFLPGLVHRIPLAALAAMLIATGVRLASPKAFVHAWNIGREQLLVFAITTVITLATDLLVGVMVGMVLEGVIYVAFGAPLRALFRPDLDTVINGNAARMTVRDSAMFSNYISIKRRLADLDPNINDVVIDLTHTRVVDHTAIKNLSALREEWSRSSRKLELIGLEAHTAFSAHRLSARRRSPQDKV